MSRRYAVLAPDWQLRGYVDAPAVLVNRRSGETVSLSTAGSYVARSCDGLSDFTSPYFLPRHVATVEAMLSRGMAVECPRGTPLAPGQPLRTAPNRVIGLLNWFVTGRCNEVCRHCYMDAPSGRYGELPTQDMLRLLDQFEAANVQRVHITGGECLLRADIWDLIAAITARRIGLHQLSTNGLLLDDDALARLRDLDVDPIVHISFDGVGTHDSMRGLPEVEDAALDTIRRTAAAGFRTAVTSCLDAETRDGILRTFDVLVEAGVHTWHVHPPMPVGCWAEQTTALPLAESTEVCEALLRRWLDAGKPCAVTLGSTFTGLPAASRDDGDGARSTESPDGPPRSFTTDEPHCRYLFTDTAYVMPDARIIPCPRFIDTPVQDAMPSLLDESLSEVWEDRALHDLLGLTKAEVIARNPECAACREWSECGAGCWALGWAATGERLGRDPEACETTREGFGRRLAAIAAEADSQ